jgi:hypothetical protein
MGVLALGPLLIFLAYLLDASFVFVNARLMAARLGSNRFARSGASGDDD